jgi:uncharacterized protein (TIGR02145 family)
MNQKSIYLKILLILFALLVTISGCSKEDPVKPVSLPDLYTISIANITQFSAITGGYITNDGGAAIIARGICWDTNNNPTLDNNKTLDGEGSGSYMSSISGLAINTNYYVRAYATNSAGTGYGNSVLFKTSPPTIATLQTKDITEITPTTAVCTGEIINDGYSPITERGICWNTRPNPLITDNKIVKESGIGLYSVKISGLIQNRTYYLRAYAINSAGIGYGSSLGFTTSHEIELPMPFTVQIKGVTLSSSIAYGNLTSTGYGIITDRGFCWNTTGNPTIEDHKISNGMGLGTFYSYINNLAENTDYFIRAFATNEAGTGYGDVLSFKTSSRNGITVSDIDGNIYHTITIGDQIWMVENLKTTRYRNGDVIPDVLDQKVWSNLNTGAYCDYNNTSDYSLTYGRLYNWYTINDNRKLAPEGWHIATSDEWFKLIDYLGGENITGGKLKESGSAHWSSPNTSATNETGFTALPGGGRNYNSGYSNITINGIWWCSSESDANSAINIQINNTSGGIFTNIFYKGEGYSVRCIKDK